MTYTAKTQTVALSLLLVISFASMFIHNDSGGILVFQILFTLLIAGLIFIRYQIRIENGYLMYQVLLISLPIFKKEVFPKHIQQIECKRIGWQKGAIIHLKKGMNIRVVRFLPASILEELLIFAHVNQIALLKKK